MKVQDLSASVSAYHLLDVRQDDEWQAGHIEGAQHIPIGQLAARLAEVPAGRPVVTVCRSGHRSAIAARGLAARGITAENLDGGLEAWARAGYPLRTPGGAPGRVI